MSGEVPEPDRIPGQPHPRETARLYGQDAAEREVLTALGSGRLHHAWLLAGPKGIGKATLAYRIARALIAGNGDAGLLGEPATPVSLDAPADCPIASRIRAGSEPLLRVLRRGVNEKTGKLRTQITIDEIRALKGFLALSAPDGGWRVVIVDAAEEMNIAAANALLKLLEEPPARTVLLLVSHAPGGLLPTIRSRCRMLALHALDPESLAAALRAAGNELADGAAIGELAQGSVGMALKLIESDGLALYGALCGALGTGGRIDRATMMALAEAAGARGGEARYELMIDLLAVLLGRLARQASGLGQSVAMPAEAAVLAAAGPPHAAPVWAEAAVRLLARASHARAVNLDPTQTVIDTFLDLDALLERTGRAA